MGGNSEADFNRDSHAAAVAAGLGSELAQLRKDRDELVAALEDALGALNASDLRGECPEARATLARIRGGG